MGGLFGGLADFIHGKGPEPVLPSGAFGTTDLVKGIGSEYGRYLQSILRGELVGSERFGRISEVFRDKADIMRRTQKGEATRFAQGRGFLDSGTVADMFAGIDRSSTEQYLQDISQLLFAMEEQGLSRIFPFLSGASQEHLGISGINVGAILAERQQNLDKGTEIGQMFMGGFGGGGGGGGFACWVARSIYGVDDPRWLVARHYVLYRAPRSFTRFYIKYGERIAVWLDSHAWVKRFIRPFFDWMVKQALK